MTVSLDAILADPDLASSLNPTDRARLFGQALTLVAVLGSVPSVPEPPPTPEDPMLTVEAAAVRLGTTVRWLRRHGPRLPFTRKLSHRVVRYSDAGLTRWLATRR